LLGYDAQSSGAGADAQSPGADAKSSPRRLGLAFRPYPAFRMPFLAGLQGQMMAKNTEKKVYRVLQLKFTLPTAEPAQFVAFIKATEPYYELFGGKQVRLLQNVDQPSQFIQIIDYEIHESFETNRQQIAGDPRLQAFLQAWRSMFPGTVEVDIFRSIDK
jgi:hypothetical protein